MAITKSERTGQKPTSMPLKTYQFTLYSQDFNRHYTIQLKLSGDQEAVSALQNMEYDGYIVRDWEEIKE